MDDKQQHKQEQLDQYLALCKRQYERMVREGTWPWPDWEEQLDSTLSKGMVDSGSNPENI